MPSLVSWKSVQAVVISLLLLTTLSLECGPGRGSGRRRRPRKLTPLVFKQHVPNVSENTIGASGLPDGPIRRKDSKFKDLVVNRNSDIYFKDEEGTGADRIMSQRCKDKLNMLAVSVSNQWPGVKLRVVEAWDEDGTHSKDSLHYEGRAVDITTSDKDSSKYGMLARLAVEAGFDWVYYESRNHIHCSVKSDSSVAIKIGGCFPSSGTVATPTGVKTMGELFVGEEVLSVNGAGQHVFSEIFAFLDRNERERALFYTISTDSGREVTLTPKHLIYVADGNSSDLSVSVRYAEDVREGHHLLLADSDVTDDVTNGRITLSRVTGIKARTEVGVYAPLTAHGSVVVDGIAVSCYAYINDADLAHFVFAPMRGLHALYSYLPWLDGRVRTNTTERVSGIHVYAKLLYDFASLFMSRNTLYVP
ncbi:sonic hedgehog protein A-like [Gigantopelta aegis]|uniref:sonic hedgehog protein A-like n=1 Tax=Gigantopelta aegis TaxID=1735272 RepID=UPI001B88AC27|nr:sonic hedgehog protein A-like [Gigantopelta aegis]